MILKQFLNITNTSSINNGLEVKYVAEEKLYDVSYFVLFHWILCNVN